MELLKSIRWICIFVLAISLANAQVRMGYFPDWLSGSVGTVDFSKLTQINYFALNPMDNAGNIPASSVWFTPANFNTVVNAARAQNPNIKILITSGGAPGSDNITARLSTVMASATARSNYANQLIRFIATNSLSGWDMDWEFPSATGSDKANQVTFLTLMRNKLDSLGTVMCKKLILSSTVGGETNHNESNPTHADYVSTSAAYIAALDYVNIMSYDACMSCHPTYTTDSPLAFAQEAVAGYSGTTLGTPAYTFNWPVSKLLIGIPFYADPSGAAYSTINASNSSTIFNEDVYGSYEYNGCPTIQAKMNYVKTTGLAGVFIWALGQDLTSTNQYSLLRCIAAYATSTGWTVPTYSSPCPLTVSFANVSGQRIGQSVVVNWSVTADENTQRFEVQRSTDGVSFSSVNSVQPNGKNQGTYSAMDLYPGSGQLYYRVLEYDNNQSITSSQIVPVDGSSELSVRIVPNPSATHANLIFDNLKSYDDAIISISDVEGQQVFYKQYGPGEVTSISIGQELGQGMYLVTIIAEGKTSVQKFLKN